MLQMLTRLLPGHVLHELGGGRAVDNVRRDREEVERTNAIVDELVGRLGCVVAEDAAQSPSAA